ncbi:hypothetical protein BKM32_15545 [Mangrovimonas sp. DI 80]|nr:hypothetical protein BKM32_15545 [Mangrovimonas sp. DI 80]
MKVFIFDNYSLMSDILISLAAFIAVMCYGKYKETPVRYFIFYLVFIVFVELVANYPKFLIFYIKGTLFERNFWWYTLCWNMGSALFFSFYFRKTIQSRKLKIILKASTVAYIVFAFISIMLDYKTFFTAFMPGINIGGMLLILMSISLYFIEVLESDKILTFYKSINFYISSVLLIYFFATIPLIFFNRYSNLADMDYLVLKWSVLFCANFMMYVTFSLALLCCKPQNQ